MGKKFASNNRYEKIGDGKNEDLEMAEKRKNYLWRQLQVSKGNVGKLRNENEALRKSNQNLLLEAEMARKEKEGLLVNSQKVSIYGFKCGYRCIYTVCVGMVVEYLDIG